MYTLLYSGLLISVFLAYCLGHFAPLPGVPEQAEHAGVGGGEGGGGEVGGGGALR